MKCRHCQAQVDLPLINLGYAPPSNAYRSQEDLNTPERTFALRVWVCQQCWLVQTEDFTQADQLFNSNYAYFSSTSKTWLDHAACYSQTITDRLGLTKNSFVIEVASNDGYLLQNFVRAGIPCLGIEPTASTAVAAEQLGIEVLREFFGEALGTRLANQGQQADLIIGNNVYAHVPDINDFTRGLKAALKPGGTITLEFPHLLNLIKYVQFDTIYHEHFSYLSLHTVQRVLAAADLKVWDVEVLPTHGGSLRVFGCHQADPRPVRESIGRVLRTEIESGLQNPSIYQAFQGRADRVKNNLLSFLIELKKAGKSIVGYGAAAKGNTLLNYAGIKPDLLPYVYDAAPSKQGKYLPGSHIPILSPELLESFVPDFVLILPWNISKEIKKHYIKLSECGTKFVIAIPELNII